MTITIHSKTNLFDLKVDAYAQGCNTKGKMGAGIAKEFRDRFPEMYANHVLFVNEHTAKDIPLIGTTHVYKYGDFAIFNLFTQVELGADARLDACYESFADMFAYMKSWNLETVAMPAIGCGIGGLVWDDVFVQLESAYKLVNYDCEVKVAFL